MPRHSTGQFCLCLLVEGKPGPQGRAAMLVLAIDYLGQGLIKGKEIQAPDILLACYKHLCEAWKLKRDYSRALGYFKDYSVIEDSVFSKANTEKIAGIEYQSVRWSDSLKAAEERKIESLRLRHERHYTYLGIAGVIALLGFSFFITKERGKSEKLLLNILPVKVAAEIKSKGVAKTRSFDNVTVLFTDFVNFTRASEEMPPQELIDELHACFKAFDAIAEKYSVEKIKTIGDAYLAVAGLPAPHHRHAEHAVMAAIEIKAFMENRRAAMELQSNHRTFGIRIGVHSGSVVAGIVGERKFAYDIWGDTVNMAARMEQNGSEGAINISQPTYELVKDKFRCVYKGTIETKTKGAIAMYQVA